MTQKWLGHVQLSTTAIYADAVGAEKRVDVGLINVYRRWL
jgi:hypothetical protein